MDILDLLFSFNITEDTSDVLGNFKQSGHSHDTQFCATTLSRSNGETLAQLLCPSQLCVSHNSHYHPKLE